MWLLRTSPVLTVPLAFLSGPGSGPSSALVISMHLFFPFHWDFSPISVAALLSEMG